MGLLNDMNKPRTEYYKDNTWKELTFQLVNLEEYKNYSVWDDTNKVFLKKGMTMTADDGEQKKDFNVEDTEFIKTDIFNAVFKGMRRSTVFNRLVVINGQEYWFSFKKTANDELKKLIESDKARGLNPLENQYKMSKEGEGKKVRYSVVISGKASLVKDAKPSVQTSFNLSSITMAQPQGLTETEKALIQAIKNQIPKEHWNATTIMTAATQYKIPMTNERAKELEKHFQ